MDGKSYRNSEKSWNNSEETKLSREFTHEDDFIREFEYFQSRTNASILIISGADGYPDGKLGPQNSQPYWFYHEDCEKVGIKPGSYHEYDSDWKTKVPIITKEAEKLDPLPPGCFYGDDILRTMDIRVANMGYYYGDSFNKLDSQKLLEDIEAVSWT